MNPQDIIIEQVGLALETFQMAVESLGDLLEQTSEAITECLLHDGKIVVCGMGASGATGASFVARMQSRFERDRPSLPAIVLSNDGIVTSAIAHDTGPGDIYARQVRSLCHEPDVLLIISSTGSASALIKAIQAAHDQGVCVIALTGGSGGDVADLLEGNDIELRVENDRVGNVQLTHHLLLNCLVELIENAIFGHEL
ncbi:SIS domain-containing protein [Reinekea sp. G2M2-21]|uniref:D-sedoheptulose-7-phosphate isomerase n=1 Tax=Reinekea sp. G2M2-21 TaxID=2788942 RepID=UPI0018AB8BC2|nr:SIS domain-containing protein [Reinekea sp. G2M2-21]MDX1340726.1 SIS domain-containing protein [Reinekea sp.]MDX1473454.1 SIS domain-containing protein [Reinekea sp.]